MSYSSLVFGFCESKHKSTRVGGRNIRVYSIPLFMFTYKNLEYFLVAYVKFCNLRVLL
jgi:hypothetical protein